ncbi:AI-2E family transporter [Euhalothece natronophila Z-M001]|uniref:AI-2E family transporter n=1 Tax=Euhalothece natronophila Z-M001 TaxID=522448 RepID=A0A5B8NNF3_9CHRO|nr:AI-2E family transporter [Euhalothece natronophila]QDZ40456.1 AI-2E family transporter [Euhalothece natronophila Z-M001]
MNRFFSPLQNFLITWILILVTGWLTIQLIGFAGGLITIFLSAALIAFLLNYPVRILKTFIPRPLAATLVYLTAIIALAVLIVTVFPLVFNQGRQLVTKSPEIIAAVQEELKTFQLWSVEHNLPFDVNFLASQLLAKLQARAQAIASTSFGLVLGTFSSVLEFILILVISFYMLLDGERVWRTVTSIFTPKMQSELTRSISRNLQKFFTGQLLLGLFMAITLTFGFRLLNVPYFLLFAFFIGTMEVIPFIGATLGISTVILVVAFIDGFLALQVLGITITIQQFKDNLIAPRIMGSLTGLSPVLILSSLLLGAKIGGFLGIILAIPITGVAKSLSEIISDPNLPPQSGAFFNNPFRSKKELVVNKE